MGFARLVLSGGMRSRNRDHLAQSVRMLWHWGRRSRSRPGGRASRESPQPLGGVLDAPSRHRAHLGLAGPAAQPGTSAPAPAPPRSGPRLDTRKPTYNAFATVRDLALTLLSAIFRHR